MECFLRRFFLLLILILPTFALAVLTVGIAKVDITPPVGTPSAGYTDRKGEGMLGVHDPLLAIALYIDNGEKQVALCSVDHLGFTYKMVMEVIRKIHQLPHLVNCEVYIGSSHTHSGGGAYLDIPVLGEALAGGYDEGLTRETIEKTAQAVIEASLTQIEAKIGLGYGKVEGISKYRGLWPKDMAPVTDLAVMKVTDLDDHPVAVLFNFALHPTLLKSQNRLFSADFVGYARNYLQAQLGESCQPIFFNGAQGDVVPQIFHEEDRWICCDEAGKILAQAVEKIWDQTTSLSAFQIRTRKEPYSFKPEATPFGSVLPVELYRSEMNMIVLNQVHAFITIPGELSSIYDRRLKEMGETLGFEHVSILGLTNDAHGYIILPESWRHKTFESALSFGGEFYGETIEIRAQNLLQEGAHNNLSFSQ